MGGDVKAIHDGERIPVLEAIKEQARDLNDAETTVECPCGRERNVQDMFQCLYCEVWFCKRCAKEHFDSMGDSNE